MEIGSISGWIAATAVALFIIAPILWFGVFRKRG
jgi:hypothetical protein